jgi:uncharacterized membrane protein
MWICGCLLMWWLGREASREDRSLETRGALLVLALRLRVLTIPSLVITLAAGGVRAFTFAEYEYVGPVTTGVIVSLVIKHIFFTAVVAWGVWIHWKVRARMCLADVKS